MDKEYTSIQTENLSFDFRNPRLLEFGLTQRSTEKEILYILWDAMDVRELVMSITASGFFKHEPLIVAKENKKNVVIEGNRRLAAVKVLLDPSLLKGRANSIPRIDDALRQNLQALPVFIKSRKDAWQYLGFKHVNGPAKWSGYAKSKFIADVHDTYGVAMEEISRQIDDTHRTVQRLYRGLMVIEQAEREGVFNRGDRVRRRFAFSHMYSGLQYEGIRSFLSLREETEETKEPVPSEKIPELKDLCRWLYGSKREGFQPVVERQNPDLRNLDAVLRKRESAVSNIHSNWTTPERLVSHRTSWEELKPGR